VAEPKDQAEDVLRAIRRIVRRIAEHSRTLQSDAGLTVPQLLCLSAVGELEEGDDAAEITVMMVSERIQLTPPTVSRIVDRLVRAGLITRERSAVDRRKVCLSLTSAGLERFQTRPRALQEMFVSRFEALGAKRRHEILTALQEVSSMMEASQLDAAPVLVPGLHVHDEG
jgi:DNA-binding MarR family transcriptional regulator